MIDLNDDNYAEFIKETSSVVFIDFYGETCGPCQTLLAYLPRLSDHFKDKNVTIAKVNVNKNPKLAEKYKVNSIPLCVVIGKDKMVKRAEEGLQTPSVYINMIEKALSEKRGFFKKLFGSKQ